MKNYNKIITIFGGSGFVGSVLIKLLIQNQYTIKIPTSNPDKAAKLKTHSVPGRINIIPIDIYSQKDIENCIYGSDIVINLIASFDDNHISQFNYLHAQLPERIAKACQQFNIEKLIHMSNLGIDNTSTIFAKSRVLGEKAVLKGFNNTYILKSSLIMGQQDHFLKILMIMASKMHFLPLIKTKQEILLQPVNVENVAQAIVKIIQENNENDKSNIYKIAGPEILSLEKIYGLIKEIIQNKCIIINIPPKLLEIIAKIMSFKILNPLNNLIFGINHSPISSEQVKILNYNNILEKNDHNFLDKIHEKPINIKETLEKIYKQIL